MTFECKYPDCNCDGRGCWAKEKAAADLHRALSPSRVEAMAREYCRLMGLDADEGMPWRERWRTIKPVMNEYIAMQLAYERTKP
jgi:hypothetical protein